MVGKSRLGSARLGSAQTRPDQTSAQRPGEVGSLVGLGPAHAAALPARTPPAAPPPANSTRTATPSRSAATTPRSHGAPVRAGSRSDRSQLPSSTRSGPTTPVLLGVSLFRRPR